MSAPSLDISQGIATITFNRPQTYNAITAEGASIHRVTVGRPVKRRSYTAGQTMISSRLRFVRLTGGTMFL